LSLALGSAALIPAVFTFGSELKGIVSLERQRTRLRITIAACMLVIQREVEAGGSTFAIYVGKNIAETLFIFAGPLFFSAVYVPMLRPDSHWIWQYLIFIGVEFSS